MHGKRLMQFGAVTGVMMLAMACGEGGPLGNLPFGGGGSSSSSGGPAPLTTTEFLKQINAAGCALQETCANVRGRSFSSSAACESAQEDQDRLLKAFYGLGLYEYYEANFQIVDQEKARACLENVRNTDCNDTTTRDADCEAAVEVRSPKQSGQECTDDFENPSICEDDDLYCDPKDDSDTCTICKTEKADGQACEFNDECQSGFCAGVTSSADGTCGAPSFKQKNQACERSEECIGHLVCAGATGSKVCSERGGVNASCDVSGTTRPRCYNDLECHSTTGTSGTCRAKLDDGQPCPRSDAELGCKHVCVFTAPDAASGTCQTVTSFPAVGQPCAALAGSGAFFCAADDNVYADVTFEVVGQAVEYTGCTCATKVANGQECYYSGACATGQCAGVGYDQQTNTITPGQCAPLLANGQACEDADECDSGFCAPGTTAAQCAAKPACP